MLCMMAEPVKDELVYSALARTRRMLGVRHARFMAVALGSSGSGFCAIMPAGLAGLCAGNGAEVGLRLARQHTNLDHHGRWLTESARGVLESYVTHGRPSAAWRLALPLPGPLVGPRLLYCPDCVAEAARLHGWAVWRRHHQLPGVQVCGRHHAWLRASPYAVFRQERLVECVPGELRGTSHPGRIRDFETALQLASCVERLQAFQGPPPDLAAARRLFRRHMTECRWLLPDGRESGFLWRALERRYGAPFLAHSGLGRAHVEARRAFSRLWSPRESGSWPALLPALLLDFLGLAADRFLLECRTSSTRPTAKAAS